MRIAIVAESFPVYSETFVADHAAGLLERGHDVRIFAWAEPRGEGRALPHTPRPLLRRVRYLDAPFPSPRPCSLASAVARTGFRAPRRARDWHARWRRGAVSAEQLNLVLPFLAERFDVVHCHFGTTGHLGVFAKRAGVGAPVAVMFHGYDLSLAVAAGGGAVYRDLFASADLFLPVSEFWRRRLIELGCPGERIAVCRLGVDLRRFAFRPRTLRPGEPVRVISVGRLVEKKGHESLIRAVEMAASRGVDLRLAVAGDGPLRGALESLAAELGVGGRVTFLGAVDHGEVADLFGRSHLFALPSVTAASGDQEGIPCSIMEAQACGLPVLSTRHGGIPELVAEGESGFLVPERDAGALAGRLEFLARRPELWPVMGRAGRAIVEEGFDRRLMLDRLEGLYEKLAAAS